MYKIILLLLCVNAGLAYTIDFTNLQQLFEQHKSEAQLFFESISVIGRRKNHENSYEQSSLFLEVELVSQRFNFGFKKIKSFLNFVLELKKFEFKTVAQKVRVACIVK